MGKNKIPDENILNCLSCINRILNLVGCGFYNIEAQFNRETHRTILKGVKDEINRFEKMYGEIK